MIFSLLIIHNYDRMPVSSNTRVLHAETWAYFTSQLPRHFICSRIGVIEAIVSDINGLQEFWRTSRPDGAQAVGSSIFAMLRLFEILQGCCDILKVCFDIFPFRNCRRLELIKMYSRPGPNFCSLLPFLPPTFTTSEPNLRNCLMGIERCLISYFLIP